MKQVSLYILIVVLSFSFLQDVKSQQKVNLDSLLEVTLKQADDTNKVNTLNKISWKFVNSYRRPEALVVANNSYEISQKIKFDKGIAYSTKSIAAVYFYKSSYDTAQTYYEISLKSFQKIKSKKGIAIAYRNLGNVYHAKGNWKQAIDYYFKSLALREDIGDKKGIASVYMAIGLAYSMSGEKNKDKALDYYKKALKINKELNSQYGMAKTYLLIGEIYFKKGADTKDTLVQLKYVDTALIYFSKSRELNLKIGNIKGIATLDEAIGNIFLAQNKLDTAYSCFKSSYEINKEIRSESGKASSMAYIGDYFRKKANYKKAIEYYLKSLKIANKTKSKKLELFIYQNLAFVYEKEKKYKELSETYFSFIKLKDTLENKENTQKMTQLAMQFEFDKKQKAQEQEKEKLKIKNQESEKRTRVILYSFIFGFFVMIVSIVLILRSLRAKKKANKLLEEKNNEILDKNTRLNQANEEIEAQRDEIEKHRDFVIEQNKEIADKNKHITDSIVYAQRIQKAVMPPDEYLNKVLSEYFILFKPRDIVSGDYYWAAQKGSQAVIVAADCTGHGVPGAFMSLLGISFLNEIVNKSKSEQLFANEILNELRESIKKSLRQTGKATESKDGMDMAICVIDKSKNELQYSGAHNPLLLIRNNELIKYKADRMPVGVHLKDKKSFTNIVIDIKENDIYYIYSDGYIDQFGGEKGRKYMNKRFNQFILDNHKKTMEEQRNALDQEIEQWKAFKNKSGVHHKQIDDILVIGFKVK